MDKRQKALAKVAEILIELGRDLQELRAKNMATFIIDEIPDIRFPWYGRPPVDLWIKLKQFVYERDKGICQRCQLQTEYTDSHCHHVLELSEHGTNHPSNLKTLCRKCHKIRHPFMRSAREKLWQGCGDV